MKMSVSPFLLTLLVLPSLWAKTTFEDHVLPIFEEHCLSCHNPDKKKGGLDLSSYPSTLAGGSSGNTLVVNDSAASLLHQVTVHQTEPVMPPEGDRIPPAQAKLLRLWIDGGVLEHSGSQARKQKTSALLSDFTLPVLDEAPPAHLPIGLSRAPVVTTSRSNTVADLESSPHAPLLAVTGQRQILLYHTETLELLAIFPFLKGEGGNPQSLSFHPSGKYLTAAGGIAGKRGYAETFDVTSGKVLMTLGHEFDSVLAAALHPSMEHLALGGPSKSLKIWDTRTGEETLRLKKHPDWITALRFSADGELLASADRNRGIQIWDGEDFSEFAHLDGHTGPVTSIQWRPDGKVLASSSDDSHLILWDVSQSKPIKKQKAHDAGVLDLAWHPGGYLVSSGRDRKVKFWKGNLTFRQELPIFDEEVTRLAFSYKGQRVFLADWHGRIHVWSVDPFKKVGMISSNP